MVVVRLLLLSYKGVPGGSAVKNPLAMQEPQETWVQYLDWEDPLEKEMAVYSSILVWRIPQRRLAGYCPQGCKESDTIEVT